MSDGGAGGDDPDPGADAGAEWRNELSGVVHGSAVQARVVHGDVYFGTAAPARMPVPAQLLPAPATFTGRSAELARLQRLAADQDPARPATLVAITGVAGVGKTSLASYWLHRERERYPDGQLYAGLGGFGPDGPVSPRDVLAGFLRAWGMAPGRVPAGLEEQAALYRSLTSGRRVIVMLDDAASAAQVRALLPGTGPGLVVVTTRRRLIGLAIDGARFVALAPLDGPAAVELLDRIAGAGRTRSEPGAARSVVRLCGRLPLAVCVSGARLAAHPRWPVERMAQELANERRRLAALSLDGDVSMRAVFDLSYQALPAGAARLYRFLALIPGPGFGADLAAAATATSPDAIGGLLDTLVDASLLEQTGDRRYGFHDLVRLHARGRAEAASPAERRAVIARRVDWYLRAAVAADLAVIPGRWHLNRLYEQARRLPAAFSGPAEALEWLEGELAGLLAARAGLAVVRGAVGIAGLP